MAIVGSRPTAGLQLAILRQDQAVLVSIPGIGRSWPSGSSSSSRRRSAAGVAAGSAAAVSSASEGEVVAALQALGYSRREAREASRLAVNDPSVGAGLEERVKAALRTLLRD
jgi:Holliday junction resolvasome RuvABC DNA-binding subunit